MEMDQKLLTRINEEKEKMKELYVPKKSFWSFFKSTTYQSTYEIANTPPYLQDQFNEFNLSNRKYTCLYYIPVLFGAGYFFIEYFKDEMLQIKEIAFSFFAIFIFLVVAFIKTLLVNINRNPIIKIDKTGINFCSKNLLIEWQFIADTYIKIKANEHSDSYSLVLHYYNKKSSLFVKKEAGLDNFLQNTDSIAYAIELMKSKQ